MRLIGNILWFVFGGFLVSLAYFLIGLILFITIIGIPFANQCFKMASLSLWPFGKNVQSRFDKHPIINIIWLIVAGWELFLFMIGLGIAYCITIIGIPFGIQWFKLAVLSLFPFGAKIS